MSQHVLRIGGRDYQAEVTELTPDRATVVVDGKPYEVELVQVGRRQVSAESVRAMTAAPPAQMAPTASTGPAAPVLAAPVPAPAPPVSSVPKTPPAKAPSATRSGPASGIVAPMPGLVIAIKVKEGESVAAGQALLVMEAMKMENAITAPYAGTVAKLYVREGDTIGEGDLLVHVAQPGMTAL